MDLCNYNQIQAMLQANGFHFSKSKGQNFLTAAWVPERIAQESGLDRDTGVVEIGPGVGCLTEQLARRVPLWEMECTKDPKAALVSQEAMSKGA